jgi:hypothetical protein
MHCTYAELAPMPLFTWFQSLCLNGVLWSRIVRKGRVVDVLGMQPGVRVCHLGWAWRPGSYSIYLAPPTSCTVTLTPHQSHTTPTTQDHIRSRIRLLFLCQDFYHTLCPFESLILDVADIVIMPASPKVQSSTAQQATISPERLSSSKKHHQTVYDDGRRQYIVERRRRADTVLEADAVDFRHRVSSKVSQRDAMTSSEHLLSSFSRSYPSTKDSAISGSLASRDGLSKKSNTSRAVVITTAVSNILEKNLASETWANPTPPPTPRMKRLPTPELSDLDETPFCPCDDPTTQAYCRSCRKQVGSSAGGF